ncbi:MerR family transcriptional regulator [Arthrobacter sp. MYb211]|uniref:MerR family transcriptional regulator n=1 Tax=Micrococcaceae TaxID=1268 RepID=UPI000CFB763A|nr:MULTISPECIES: MerR family transcriptional regulator [unclassified Arthrobacter]PQZ98284.1 MerR family transcriptional regulator [Arthrobacter sp. MYb224]PQZ98516.1 MerR family transcriptional regulator [Arthrobacter sp. MYb229]PRA09932.1 MerR family transcriptional regulator [Arthrobacter sp. MYb221]PRB47241.1 MerR family transcriptional regulator [Arthrobacter sp. MYb216]PRC05013.1 MerR family transcriptional regulator [Arthrobacter sp. MYb211]
MPLSFIPPRQVNIGDAAAFVGTTPQAIRRYHEIGLLPEPERGSDDRPRYGYEDMIRLLWIHKMTGAGFASEEIRDAFAGTAPVGADSVQNAAIAQRMRTPDGRMGLLSDFVTCRLKPLPKGSLRQADLDSLLVTERIFGPLGAALQATRFIAIATHPGLQEESDRVDIAEEALDDTIAAEDPRVALVAAKRHAFELQLHAVIEGSSLALSDEAIVDSWDALHPENEDEDESGVDQDPGTGPETMSAIEAIGKMPYDFSPARLRCMELAEELATSESPGS